MIKNDLHTDNTNYIDTPFTLELKGYIKELEEKIKGYKKATQQLNRIVAHRDEVISLRDITIHRLRGELSTLEDREDSRLKRLAYDNWAKEVDNQPIITREDLYDCNP